MTANRFISNREYKLLLSAAFSALAFTLLLFSLQAIKDFNDVVVKEQSEIERLANNTPKYEFSACGGTRYRVPPFHFLTFFILIALLKTKRFILPSILVVFYGIIFIYGLSARYDGARLGGEEFSPRVDFLDKIYRAAFDFDYVFAFFILILLFWQISILLRIFITTSQGKTGLP